MRSSGKVVVFSIFAVAIAMASFALWWNWGLGRRSLEFWGKEAGLAIRDADKVEILKLKTTSTNESREISKLLKASHLEPRQPKKTRDENGTIQIEDSIVTDVQLREVLETKDVTGAHGLVHARHAFLEDASFKWEESVSYFGPDWQYAVRFRTDSSETTVLLDLKGCIAGTDEQNRAVRLSPKTAAGWKHFISRYFSDEALKPAKAPPAKSK